MESIADHAPAALAGFQRLRSLRQRRKSPQPRVERSGRCAPPWAEGYRHFVAQSTRYGFHSGPFVLELLCGLVPKFDLPMLGFPCSRGAAKRGPLEFRHPWEDRLAKS